jgi:prepilin-type N-terminal cleavage/methylation domain-containing protein
MAQDRFKSSRGLTLIEVLIAMFVFLIGIVGVMAAMPVGIDSASLVIFQDASIHLSASKFAEFRRDAVDPAADLADGSSYMNAHQEPLNSGGNGYRDFAHTPGATYEYFDSIERYEWKVDQAMLKPVGVGVDDLGRTGPVENAGTPLPVTRVTIDMHLKGSTRHFRFTQYMVNLQ